MRAANKGGASVVKLSAFTRNNKPNTPARYYRRLRPRPVRVGFRLWLQSGRGVTRGGVTLTRWRMHAGIAGWLCRWLSAPSVPVLSLGRPTFPPCFNKGLGWRATSGDRVSRAAFAPYRPRVRIMALGCGVPPLLRAMEFEDWFPRVARRWRAPRNKVSRVKGARLPYWVPRFGWLHGVPCEPFASFLERSDGYRSSGSEVLCPMPRGGVLHRPPMTGKANRSDVRTRVASFVDSDGFRGFA